MQLRYLRHRYDVVYDCWIAAVRKSAVWIFAAIEYSITPVVLEGMRPSKDIGGDIGRMQPWNDYQRFIGKDTIRCNFLLILDGLFIQIIQQWSDSFVCNRCLSKNFENLVVTSLSSYQKSERGSKLKIAKLFSSIEIFKFEILKASIVRRV